MERFTIKYIQASSLVMLFIAITTFGYFDSYHLLENRSSSLLALLLLIISPILGLLFGIIALISTNQFFACVAKINAGCIFSTLSIIYIISTHDRHANAGSVIGYIILQLVYIILIIQVLCIIAGDFRKKRKNIRPPKFRWLLIVVPIIILGGWSLGVVSWSYFYKNDVIEAAEKEAGNSPYCMFSLTKQANSKYDLMPINMYNRGNDCCFRFDFHSVLIIDHHPPKFMNWSYDKKQFDLLSDRTVDIMSLRNRFKQCQFKQHFARELP